MRKKRENEDIEFEGNGKSDKDFDFDDGGFGGYDNGPSKSISAFERVMKMVSHYNPWEFLKGFILIAILLGLISFFSNPTKIFQMYDKMKEQQHTELLNQRAKVGKDVQNICENLLYESNADRVIFLEGHNGSVGAGGLPFRKVSATYEVINNVYPIADQYQNTNLSLIPFARYLGDKKYWKGNVDDLIDIDRSLGYRMKSNGTEYFEAVAVQGIESQLGFIFVSYSKKEPEYHDSEYTMNLLDIASKRIALLIEIDRK